MKIKDKLKEENEELKDRIKAGAKEYSKLLEKYHMVKNQQFNSELNAYNDMSGDVQMNRFTPQMQQQQPRNDLVNKRNVHNSQSSMFLRQRVGGSNAQQETTDNDSTIQNKSLTQSMRGGSSSAEIENTLLDALLSTSLYAWQGSANQQQNKLPNQISPNSQITTSQPRMLSLRTNDMNMNNNANANLSPNYHQTSDLSDDGLVHAKTQNPTANPASQMGTQLKQTSKLTSQEDNVFGNKTFDKLIEI
jgi:hypothetical protein